MKNIVIALIILLAIVSTPVQSSVNLGFIRKTAESIMHKFGRGTANESIDQLTKKTAMSVKNYGKESLPFL